MWVWKVVWSLQVHEFNLLEKGCQIYCLTPTGLKGLVGQILNQGFECRLVEGTGRRKAGAEIGYW